MTEKIYRQHSEHNSTEWFEGYEQNIASDFWLFLYFTILLLFVGFIRWIYYKISAIFNAKKEENDDISEPLIIESNFSEMESELAVIQIESEFQKLDRSQSAEEINVIHIPHNIHNQSQNMVPFRGKFRARGISLDPALLLRRYSEIAVSQTVFEF